MKRIAMFLVILALLISITIPSCNGGSTGNGSSNGYVPPPPPAPAEFRVSNLAVTPDEVDVGDEVVVSVDVANTGGSQGDYSTTLSINGIPVMTERITLSTSASQTVTFNVTRWQIGTYGVSIDDQSGSFSVLDMQVIFPDPNLETIIREAIPKPQDSIYASDLESISKLNAFQRGISDLTGLEYCWNLSELWLHWNNISDISPLAGLTNLENLFLHGNNISDVSPLAGLTNLEDINLDWNNISDISPLAELTNLRILWFHDNSISDISPLADLTNLVSLHIGENNISDISPLVRLTNLDILYAYGNNISDISHLAGLVDLVWLHLYNNNVSDISPLIELTDLENLSLYNNNISDVSPLVENSGLSSGDTIDLTGNPLIRESIEIYIPQLIERGVDVILDSTVPFLLSPDNGEIMDNGRYDFQDYIVWDFDWSDVAEATHYHLYVIGPSATYSVIDNSSITSSEYQYQSSGYIASQNSEGWTWKVKALVDYVWGEWSEIQVFNVEPVNTDPPSP